ncbi:TonB-dependent receptor, partial [gut metagenome]
ALPAFSQSPVDTTLVMGNVEVVGGRFAGLSSVDGTRRLRVDENISAVTHTTSELLRQLPSVITDIEGDVVFRGSGDVGMAIDGVPYGMLEEYSGDLFIQLPALFFDRLSLASYPSVNVIPDGDAGMLDMLPRRLKAGESPLHLTLGAGWYERYNAGAMINLHPGKFHINAKYNYRREFRKRSFSKSTTTPKNRTEMVNSASARPDVHLAELSVGYDLSPNDKVYASGLYYLMDYDRYGRINNRVYNPQGKQMKYVIRNRYNDQRQDAYAVEAGWEHSFSNDARFHARFNYNNFSYDEDNDFKNEKPETGKIVAEEISEFDHDKHFYFWEAGYDRQVDNWSFSAG